ncbi:MAG: hypothetical protein Q8P67_06965, partial [archaeon]|nr:hypothetical protein [archaeon]
MADDRDSIPRPTDGAECSSTSISGEAHDGPMRAAKEESAQKGGTGERRGGGRRGKGHEKGQGREKGIGDGPVCSTSISIEEQREESRGEKSRGEGERGGR